jgi:putative ABC transport system ATP-binding protein
MSESNAWAIDLEVVGFAWPGGQRLLSIPSLKIARGERVFLKGPSGSGKSTLLGLIGGVLKPTHGTVSVLGQPLRDLSGARRDAFRAAHVGFIFQMFNLLPFLSMIDNVALTVRFSKERASRVHGDVAAEARRLLFALGLNDPELYSRPVTSLSIGQQQRVAAARALLGRPDLVIEDEPTSALDADTRLEFLALLKGECSDTGATLLFVSHDSALASAFDRQLAITITTGATLFKSASSAAAVINRTQSPMSLSRVCRAGFLIFLSNCALISNCARRRVRDT